MYVKYICYIYLIIIKKKKKKLAKVDTKHKHVIKELIFSGCGPTFPIRKKKKKVASL